MSKNAVIFGAGNVGRGFIGQLFSESGYRVTFADIDKELVQALSERGWYRLQTVRNDDEREQRIGPVSALPATDTERVAAAVAEAQIGATAVGARALPHIAAALARGIERRARAGAGPLNLIICENLHGAAAVVRGLVQARLPAEFHAYLDSQVGFVDTVIGRMVPIPTPEMRAADVSLIRVEPYKELPVDRRGFAGPVPEVVAMTAHASFPVFTARKLYIHNCGHALLAYPGFLRGYTYGWETLGDAAIRHLLAAGLRESRDGIVRTYGADAAWLDAHIVDLLDRFANRALGDTVFRLGRDPVRKLQADDRLVGAARGAEQAGCRPRHLAFGIAAALLFHDPGDPVSVELLRRLGGSGPAVVLREVSGIDPAEPLGRQVLESYAALRQDPAAALARLAGSAA